MLELFGVGPETAGQLLASAGDNPERVRPEAAFAHLAGVAPIPASSGRVHRHRLNRGGDRAANNALHTIALVRMRHDPTHPHLRPTPHQARTVRQRHHPLPQTLHRPRGLPRPDQHTKSSHRNLTSIGASSSPPWPTLGWASGQSSGGRSSRISPPAVRSVPAAPGRRPWACPGRAATPPTRSPCRR
ncbi:transposase [Actinosynnema sp. CS-041913]|uniref:transposase n=1 Tax=Actinosynnema sp. CS-041913 TaxID=3239917 RepID=UPI003D93AC47